MSTIKVNTLTTLDGTGNITLSRPLSGSGASLTNLPAANLTGTLPAIDGSNLTGVAPTKAAVEALGIDLPAANLTGTVADARFPATLPASSGVNLTALNASNLSTGTLPIARIADDAVTNAKMADDAIGVAQLSATGTPSASTFLRGDNAWAAAGTTAGLVKISTNSISTPATLVAFDSSLVTSTYSHYRLVVEGLSVATDGDEIGIKLSVDNGSTFATHVGMNVPMGGFSHHTPTGTYVGNRNYHWFLHEMEATVGTGGGSAYCDIFNANSTTDYKYLISEGALHHYGDPYYMSKAWSVFKSTSAVNYIKVYDVSGGNMDGGKFTLYGYA